MLRFTLIAALLVGCKGSGSLGNGEGDDTGGGGVTDTGDTGAVGPCDDWQAPAYVTPNCGVAPLTVSASGTAIVEGNAHSADSWSWGDGNSTDELDATYTYETPGDYELSFSTNMDVDGSLVDITVENIRVRVLAP